MQVWLHPTFRWPIAVPRWLRFILPSRLKSNSKAASVVAEFTSAGMPARAFSTTSYKSLRQLLNRDPGGSAYLPCTSLRCDDVVEVGSPGTVGKGSSFSTREDQPTGPQAAPFAVATDHQRREPRPSCIAAAPAIAENRKVVWWQDDHHHTEELTYPVDAAAVQAEGLANVRERSPSAFIAARPPMKSMPFRRCRIRLWIGIATNSFFTGISRGARSAFHHPAPHSRQKDFYLRLHPNSKVQPTDIPESWISIAPPAETLYLHFKDRHRSRREIHRSRTLLQRRSRRPFSIQ